MNEYEIKLEGRARSFCDLLRIITDALDSIDEHEETVKEYGFRMNDVHSSGEFSLDIKLIKSECDE